MTDEAPVRPGDVLAGKYRVERVLGVGGMGVVVAARHQQLDRMVALKFVLAERSTDGASVERFLREARASVRLKSEHVAKVLDVGTLESGAPYIVMEYLDGSDLAAVLAERGPLHFSCAVDYVLQACEAVGEAHSLGIIHRDLKPQNLFLTQRVGGGPLVKVLDFGISKLMTAAAGSARLTRTNYALGSPLYMAPEQMRSSKTVDERADVWALGVVLYELIAGETPFKGESLPEVCLKAVSEAPEPIRRPGVPRELEAIIGRCLAKDPAGRYPNVAELALALAPFAPPHSHSAPNMPNVPNVAMDGSDRAAPSAMGPGNVGQGSISGVPQPTPAAWAHRGRTQGRPLVYLARAAAVLFALGFVVVVVVFALKHKKSAALPTDPPEASSGIANVESRRPAESPPGASPIALERPLPAPEIARPPPPSSRSPGDKPTPHDPPPSPSVGRAAASPEGGRPSRAAPTPSTGKSPVADDDIPAVR